MKAHIDSPTWARHYSPGVPATIDVPGADVVALFAGHVSARPDAPCLLAAGGAESFSSVDERSDALAVAFDALGVVPGDRVGLSLQNTREFVVVALATWKLGAVLLPINPMYRSRELSTIAVDARPSVLVLDPTMASIAAAAELASDVVVLYGTDDPNGDIGRLTSENLGRRPRPRVNAGDDLALLTYTSGTTGDPKGALHCHRNLSYEAELSRVWLDLHHENDVVLTLAPMFHITGMILHLVLALSSGCPLVLTHRFTPRGAAELIERYRPTFTVGAITAYIALLNDSYARTVDLSCLTKALTGGAPVPAATVAAFEDHFGIYLYNAFGMTETTSATILVPLGGRAPVDEASGALSVGVPVPAVEVRVLDADGRQVAAGEVGELAIKGPQVVLGYWERPDATAAMKSDGYLLTGDMALLNDDGWVFLVDRKKDMIIASGYKVWPREVEDVLYEHPAVREAAVVGVPDNYRGQDVRAFVSLREGTSVTETELITHSRARLAAYKVPREVLFVDELPKTISGKVMRRVLRDDAAGEPAQGL